MLNKKGDTLFYPIESWALIASWLKEILLLVIAVCKVTRNFCIIKKISDNF